jgi:hypothetical protein
MAIIDENLVLPAAQKPDRQIINQLLINLMMSTALSEFPMHVDAWIVDCDFQIAGTFGMPFEIESSLSLHDAFLTPRLKELMVDKHNDAFLEGASAFSTVIGSKQKFICLTRVFYLENIAYIVGYSLDSSDLRDIYNQLLSIREKTHSLQSNEKIRVTVDAILNSNIFKMFIKTAGG